MGESRILTLGDDTVLVECGPMRMFIDASQEGVRRPDLCTKAARQAIDFLGEIASDKQVLQRPAISMKSPGRGRLAHAMWKATCMVGDADLTPMAAVAGTIADATADYLLTMGLDRVIVNNGGDVALRLAPGETVAVGIREDVNRPTVSHRVRVTAEDHVCGICTSGLGGRSFTRGVASAATVFASRASLADAAATAVANATNVSSTSIRRGLADTIDPETDLKGISVTISVGSLTDTEIERALSQGISRAETLVMRGLITGACVFVQGRGRSTFALSRLMEPFQAI
jgi:uncharacterized protein